MTVCLRGCRFALVLVLALLGFAPVSGLRAQSPPPKSPAVDAGLAMTPADGMEQLEQVRLQRG